MTIKARPTTYNGIAMRSRLEAAFAQWLDAPPRKIQWQYEPRAYASDGGQYLPDFVESLGRRTRVWEVKPSNADFDAALNRMHIVLASEPNAELSVVTSADYQDFVRARNCSPSSGCGRCNRGRSGALADLIDLDGYSDHESRTLCGQCHRSYTHLGGIAQDQRPLNCFREDHSAIELTFWCETCEFHTIWNIHNHKGETMTSFRTSPAPAEEEEKETKSKGETAWSQ